MHIAVVVCSGFYGFYVGQNIQWLIAFRQCDFLYPIYKIGALGVRAIISLGKMCKEESTNVYKGHGALPCKICITYAMKK